VRIRDLVGFKDENNLNCLYDVAAGRLGSGLSGSLGLDTDEANRKAAERIIAADEL
jgi:hypothetical protein